MLYLILLKKLNLYMGHHMIQNTFVVLVEHKVETQLLCKLMSLCACMIMQAVCFSMIVHEFKQTAEV